MLLPDLRIKNYRLFKDFEIERLARVNLIAGRNNAGKSALLEAAYLVANQQQKYAVFDVLRSRGWIGGSKMPFSSLFRGYWFPDEPVIEIFSGENFVKFVLEEAEVLSSGESRTPLRIEYASGEPIAVKLRDEDGVGAFGMTRSVPFAKQAYLLPSGGISWPDRFSELTALWEDVLLTTGEEPVVNALRLLEQGVERLTFTRSDILIRLTDSERWIRLGDLGDGVRHLLMMALLLAIGESGVVLIDEIDTGLHYTVLVDLWRLIFQTAKRLNVQVLATTHSWDCITAFSQAWNEVDGSEGLFFRLSKKGDRIKPVVYSAERLNVAAEQGIEVR
jgi:hypothetical protein